MDQWTQLSARLPPRRPPHWAVPSPYSQAKTGTFQTPALLWMEAAGRQPRNNGEKSRSGCTVLCPPHLALWAAQLGTQQLSQLLHGNPTAAAALHSSEPVCCRCTALPNMRETEARGWDKGRVHKQCLSCGGTRKQCDGSNRGQLCTRGAAQGLPHPNTPPGKLLPKKHAGQQDEVKPSAWNRIHVKGQHRASGTAVGQEESGSHTTHGTKSERPQEHRGKVWGARR